MVCLFKHVGMTERLDREISGCLSEFTVKIRRENSIENMTLGRNYNIDFMEKERPITQGEEM